MKLFISSLILFSTTAFATDISVSKKNIEYRQYTEILTDQVYWAERSFDQYSEEVLGCSRVKFALTINKKPGVFRSGNYDLKLTAKCTETFENFTFDLIPGYDESYTILNVSFVKNGELVKKSFKTNAWM